MLLLIFTLFLSASAQPPVSQTDARTVGAMTDYSVALIGEGGAGPYGLHLTRRDGRVCQLRVYFQGQAPRMAEYCAGRVVSRHVEEAGLARMETQSTVTAIAACFSSDLAVAAVRLAADNGESATAQALPCAGDYTRVSCAAGWAVQGLYLYFDGPADGRQHRRLVGLRPLCANL